MIGRAQLDVAVAPDQPQEIPDLLLPAIAAAPLALDPVLRNIVAQPVSRAPEHSHVLGGKPHFFLELPVHRQLGLLPGVDPPLRELPRVLANPLSPEDEILRV